MTSLNDQKQAFLDSNGVRVVGIFQDKLKREWCLYHLTGNQQLYVTGEMFSWEMGYELTPDYRLATRMIVFDDFDVEQMKAVVEGRKTVQVTKAHTVVDLNRLRNDLELLKTRIDDGSFEKEVGAYSSTEIDYSIQMLLSFVDDSRVKKALKGTDDEMD